VLGRTGAVFSRGPRFNQTLLVIDAAVAGQGLAVVSRILVEYDLRTARLALAETAHMRGRDDYYVVAPRKPRRRDEAATVRAWLLAGA
jgi:LysR family glycine cleavage system transcriptional activator